MCRRRSVPAVRGRNPMDLWQASLAVAALVVAIISIPNPRGLLWVLAGAATFVVTALYQPHALPWLPFPAVAAVADGLVALAILLIGLYRWEMRVANVFMGSMLINIIAAGYLAAGSVLDPWLHVAILDACNILALAIIAGPSLTLLLEEARDVGPRDRARSRLHRFMFAIRASRRRALERTAR